MWLQYYSFDYHTSFSSLIFDDDSSIVIAGASSPQGIVEDHPTNGFITKLDKEGHEVWFWESTVTYTQFETVVPAEDGYIAVEIYYNAITEDSMFVHTVKVSLSGELVDEVWTYIGRPRSSWVEAKAISPNRILVTLFAWNDGYSIYEIDEDMNRVWTF